MMMAVVSKPKRALEFGVRRCCFISIYDANVTSKDASNMRAVVPEKIGPN
jgi:hypothetical protein